MAIMETLELKKRLPTERLKLILEYVYRQVDRAVDLEDVKLVKRRMRWIYKLEAAQRATP